MRLLVPIVVLLAVATACGGGSTSSSSTVTPRATSQAVFPFTPAEEVLTPPPDIDTSAWLTYKDEEHGFELKYPPDARLMRNAARSGLGEIGVGTEIDLPFERGTTLEEKYIFIKVADTTPQDCVPYALSNPGKPGATPDVTHIRADHATFWRSFNFGGGMMHGFAVQTYMTSKAASCVRIDGVLYGVNAGSFGETPPPPPNRGKEEEVFTAIISTFRWLDQP